MRTLTEEQASVGKLLLEQIKDLFVQAVFLKEMTEAQNRSLIGTFRIHRQTDKAAACERVVQRLLTHGIRTCQGMIRSKVSRNLVLLAPPSCGEVSANKSANEGALIFIITLFRSVLIISHHPPFVQRFLSHNPPPLKRGLQQISLKLSFQRAPVFFLKSRSCHGIRVYKVTPRLRHLCRIDIHSSKKLKIFYSTNISIFDQTW